MSENNPPRFDRITTLLFRAFCLYLIFYVLFLSDFLSLYYVLWHVNTPFKYITDSLGAMLNKIFFKPGFKEIHYFDSYWAYSILLTLLVIAIISAVIWTTADKGKGSRKLFVYMHAFSRYYLFVAMMLYGVYKLFGNQLTVAPHMFLQPMDFYQPQMVIWTAMAASKSYPIFGGIMEVTACLLLLSRRTATLGALISLSLLVNILVLNFGFDTPVKTIVFHLLLFTVLILSPDIVKLFGLFILKQPATLTTVPSVIENKKYKQLGYALKLLIIGIAVIPKLVYNVHLTRLAHQAPYKNLIGIHEIDSFYSSLAGISSAYKPKLLQKFSIEARNRFYPLLPDGSVPEYQMEIDTQKKTIQINLPDSLFNFHLVYQNIDSTHWFFEGTHGQDSVRFVTRQINIYTHPLLRNYGKIIWSWDPARPPE